MKITKYTELCNGKKVKRLDDNVLCSLELEREL